MRNISFCNLFRYFAQDILFNIMEEWGGKYNTKGEAWETLKGICASSDIRLQDVLQQTEKEVMPEVETEADIVDEENEETIPFLANEEHNENSEKEVVGKSESDQMNSKEAAKKTIITNKNDTEGSPLDTKKGKEEVVTSDGTKEKQEERQPEIAHIKGTQAEQDMIALHENTTQGNVVYTKESSINKGRQTEGSTDQKFPGEAPQAATESTKSDQNVHRVYEETIPSTSQQERKDPNESSPGAESGSKQTDV